MRSDTLRIRVDVLKIWYGSNRRRIEPYNILVYILVNNISMYIFRVYSRINISCRMKLLLRQYGVAQGITRIDSFYGGKVVN